MFDFEALDESESMQVDSTLPHTVVPPNIVTTPSPTSTAVIPPDTTTITGTDPTLYTTSEFDSFVGELDTAPPLNQ